MFDKTRITGAVLQGLAALACVIIVAMVAIILGNILIHGLDRLSVGFLTRAPEAGMTGGGIFPAIFGTFALVLLMTIAVIPLGVATAIYMHEYAPKRSRMVHVVRLAIQNLAGVPAIVFGLFGLGFFIEFIGRGVDRAFFGGSLVYGQPAIIWAALTMALLTMPTVVVATEEALRAIPQSYREVAYSLGATRWQMISRIVLPQAVGGILTGGILAVSRGSGEVAPVMFTGAAYFLPELPRRLNDQFMELGYHVYVMTTQSPDVEATKPILYSTVLVLLMLTFLLNFTAIMIRARIRKRLRYGR
ncbi:MAG: phosphate transporter, inner rane subunit PstA [Acidobacteria bacterium]|jgi:phosphate transport system permease protein|nr:phosphate transporter, inner rane subunit PstA [Acidobacteriota bacterium]